MKSKIISSVRQNSLGHEHKKTHFKVVSKRILLLSLSLIFSNSVLSQNLNNYKYASVPSKFSILKEADKYNLSTLSKLFMQKYGFETYLDTDQAPYEFTNSNCNKVYVDLEKNNSMFLTRVKVLLKDCNGKVLFTSKEGSSKEKELRVAYNEALREAFISLAAIKYNYVEKKETEKPMEISITDQPKAIEPQTSISTGQLFAQPIQNGFQLINSEPKVVMKIFKTSIANFYIAIKGNMQGVLVAKNSEWFFEYYPSDKLISEKVDVKF